MMSQSICIPELAQKSIACPLWLSTCCTRNTKVSHPDDFRCQSAHHWVRSGNKEKRQRNGVRWRAKRLAGIRFLIDCTKQWQPMGPSWISTVLIFTMKTVGILQHLEPKTTPSRLYRNCGLAGVVLHFPNRTPRHVELDLFFALWLPMGANMNQPAHQADSMRPPWDSIKQRGALTLLHVSVENQREYKSWWHDWHLTTVIPR